MQVSCLPLPIQKCLNPASSCLRLPILPLSLGSSVCCSDHCNCRLSLLPTMMVCSLCTNPLCHRSPSSLPAHSTKLSIHSSTHSCWRLSIPLLLSGYLFESHMSRLPLSCSTSLQRLVSLVCWSNPHNHPSSLPLTILASLRFQHMCMMAWSPLLPNPRCLNPASSCLRLPIPIQSLEFPSSTHSCWHLSILLLCLELSVCS